MTDMRKVSMFSDEMAAFQGAPRDMFDVQLETSDGVDHGDLLVVAYGFLQFKVGDHQSYFTVSFAETASEAVKTFSETYAGQELDLVFRAYDKAKAEIDSDRWTVVLLASSEKHYHCVEHDRHPVIRDLLFFDNGK